MKNFTADMILQIPVTNPEKLFTGDLIIAKNEYKDFSRKWHPDLNKQPNAAEVFSHIVRLYEEAVKLISNNLWKGKGTLSFNINGKILNISYSKIVPFEIGEYYFGKNHIVYSIKQEYSDFFKNARTKIEGLKFADTKMKEHMSKFIPTSSSTKFLKTNDRMIMIVDKTEDIIPLRDLLNHYNGVIDPKHVAWMMSSLYNIACYLSYTKLSHLNIDIDTCFVSPKYHAVYLFGGWWFSKDLDSPFSVIPSRTAATLSPDVLRNKIAKPFIDLDTIRWIGRELLGDRSGEHLKYDKTLPEQMVRWVRASTTEDAINDYRLWKEVLDKCFGPPKFIKMDLDINLFY